jgi:2-aminoadipate transaminase
VVTKTYAQAGPECVEWLRGRGRSALRRMVERVSRPGVLSLAGGLPAPELFPARAYGEAVQKALATDPRALQYGASYEPLRTRLAALLGERGVACEPGDLLLTHGAQQAIGLAAGLLLAPGATIVVEEAVYTGALEAFAPYSPRILTVGTDPRTGFDVDALEALLAAGERPAFVYLIPEAHNPTGATLSDAKRERLAELAERYHVPLIEDDAYGLLVYDGAPGRPLKALAPDWTLHIGSFSKVIAPALRLGYIVVPPVLRQAAQLFKESADLECSALTQRALATLLEDGFLSAHVATLRETYRARRDAMIEALEAEFPAGTRFSRPRGGFFVWVELPGDVDTSALLDRALEEEGVAFVPGSAFSADGRGSRRALRLSFASQPPEAIREGVRRLGRLLRSPAK